MNIKLKVKTVKKKVFLGSFVYSKDEQHLTYLHNAAVCVDADGIIKKVISDQGSVDEAKAEALREMAWNEDDDNFEIMACKKGQFFFPGFIDTHIHAPQYPNAGIFGNSTLLDWLNRYTFPLEASLTDLDKAKKVYTAVVRRTLSHGTTTAAYYATIDVAATNLLADLCLSIGQRAFVGRVCMDDGRICPKGYKDESVEESLRKTLETIRHCESIDPTFEIVSPILTPRFAPSCTSDSMNGLAKIQKEKNLPVQTHISENQGEVDLVAELFPGSSSYAGVYDDHGLLTPKTILAHAVHLTQEEMQLISAREAKISHCPCSNTSLTSGAAQVRKMWDANITVGLGTDVSGGYSPSILEAARQAVLVSRHVVMGIQENKTGCDNNNKKTMDNQETSEELERRKEKEEKRKDEAERVKLTPEEVLYLATRGGAEVVGLSSKLGAFEVGMDFDAQLIHLGEVDAQGLREGEEVDGALVSGDVGNVDIFGWETWEERMAKWVYGGDDRNTRMVWVKGRLVHAKK